MEAPSGVFSGIMPRFSRFRALVMVAACALAGRSSGSLAAELLAGTARTDITDYQAGPVNDPSFAKALVLSQEGKSLVLLTLDAVAVEEIGRLGKGFMATVRSALQKELGLAPESVVVNASHCHGIVRADSAQLAIQAVKEAWGRRVPVTVGTGAGHEDAISENRRLKLKDGSETDMRRAYAMPTDGDVASTGLIDPQVGLLRLDRKDGRPLALLYQFACHPIMNPPSKGSSADYPAFASKVIEDSLGGEAMAFFIQGCGGDINPVRYKEVSVPPDAEPLGNRLGLSVMKAARQIRTEDPPRLEVKRETLSLPRGTDLETRIRAIETEQAKLLAGLKPTNISFKTFLPLLIQQRMTPDFPSHYSQSYLHDRALNRPALDRLDTENKASVETYLQNIQTLERLTRLGANLALLKKHLAQNQAAGSPTVEVELVGLRIGSFKMVTFPGELTVQVGLDIKKAARDPHAFVAGYTNGYIYYAATAEQRSNTGYAQEDCDAILAPEWQKIFETRALSLLQDLAR